MGNESGTWIMYGVSREDPECIHTVDEAVEYINKVGFLPLFKNEIPGFSLEERTAPEYWWSGDAKSDPWEWREIIARSGKVAYGKFFDKKAGFISKQWFPYFANRRLLYAGASLGTGSCDKRLYRVSGFLRRKNRSTHAGNLPDCNQAAGTSVGGEYCCAVIDKILL